LVTWALATVIVAAVAASSVASGVGGTVKAASSVVGQSLAGASAAAAGNAAATGGAASSDAPASLEYGIDKLFRASGSGPSGSATSTGTGAPAAASISGAGSSISSAAGSASTGGSAGTPSGGAPERRMEVARIMMHSVSDGVSGADRTYLVGLVAARTGVSNAEAEQRVDDFIAAVKQAQDKVRADADAARKDAAEVSIYTALALLIGAFIASVAAALGGRLRDEHV
jgi:hypothetical protein